MADGAAEWEREMIARLEVGDERALAAIYDQYAALVHGVAARLVDRTSAADITQQVFVRLWERPDAFDPQRGSLRTFLAVMARRRAIDHLRSAERAQRHTVAAAREVPATVPNVDEAAMAMIAAERVRHALTSLPDEQRRAIELAYFDGLTFREVAVATGVPEGTAKSRLRLALARLAAHLHTDGAIEWA